MLSYVHFQRLLDLKFSLLRRPHQEPPSYRPKLHKAIHAIDERLQTCDDYRDFLREYAQTTGKVG